MPHCISIRQKNAAQNASAAPTAQPAPVIAPAAPAIAAAAAIKQADIATNSSFPQYVQKRPSFRRAAFAYAIIKGAEGTREQRTALCFVNWTSFAANNERVFGYT